MVPGIAEGSPPPADVGQGARPGQPSQRTGCEHAEQHDGGTHGEAHPVRALAHIMQQRRREQLTVGVTRRRQRGTDIQAMALVAARKTFGVLSQITPRCVTVFEAYRQTERYVSLVSQGARMSVVLTPKTLDVSCGIAAAGTPLHSNIMFWALTNLSLMPKRLTGVDIRPKLVACDFAAPSAAAVRTLNEFCPFTFDANQGRVTFDRSVGNLGIPSADADLQKLLAGVMEQHLTRLGPVGSFEQGLLVVLSEMMNGTMPTLASLSARAGMSQRTLQRRLGEARTSFQALLQKVLQGQAEKLLARGDLSQGEIAFLLGYSEVSAFSRAYRRWTGHPPGAAYA